MAGKRKKASNLATILILVVGILLVAASGIYIGRTLLEYQKGKSEYDDLKQKVFGSLEIEASQEQDVPPKAEDEASQEESPEEEASWQEGDWQPQAEVCEAVTLLKADNEDVIGWLDFEDMDLSYPIMQGEDDDEYLYHTFSKEYNSAGSIFMEALNHSDFSDSHTILYGHNMKNGTMFGKLKNYRKEDFYEGNKYFTVYTEEEMYRYQVFAYYDISEYGDVYDIHFDSVEEFDQFLGKMLKRSYYDTGVTVKTSDKVITLSTCSSEGNRFVVNAVRVDSRPAR